MNEEIDEYDIYHQDFTTASEWEVFIARIEEIINDWNLSKSKISKCPKGCAKKWIEKSEELNFYGLSFTLSYYTLDGQNNIESADERQKDDLENKSLSTQILNEIWEASKSFIDIEDGDPCTVSSWYGLKQYILLNPKKSLTEESQMKMVMSSINIAFANVDCGVPIFVKIREHWQNCFLGIFEDNDCRISFDTIHLKRIPNQCYHLNGLCNLFKGKISSPVSLDPIQISAKFSYELKDFEAFAWTNLTNDDTLSKQSELRKWIELPFGSDLNPIQNIFLNVIWPRFIENAVIDSATYSDFDPVMAPTWTVTLKMCNNVSCLLSQTIENLLDLLDNNKFLMDTLGLSRSLGLINPLYKITEAPITFSKLVKAAIGTPDVSNFKGPISDELLMPLLYYIFPDAVDDNSYPYQEHFEIECKQGENTEPKLCGYVKASPNSGLVWRLSVVAARLYDEGGLPYLAHFWYEFTQELQYRWEHHILIPGVAEGNPNARTCLLHQKLQLLNCCIRRAGEAAAAAVADTPISSEDEFYDCSDGESGDDQPMWDRPLGRLCRFGDATLKNGAPLYIPKTQDPAPKTEDQLEEDADLMVRLGDDARASELRARMMSASLLSDMEAFKAANPGSELVDFVRWYSPRDWRPDDGGTLGDRMLLPGNPWVEAWSVAQPVPAARQRRLFDETRVAEQALHYLRSRTVGAVAALLLPGVLRAGAACAVQHGATASGTNVSGYDQRRIFEVAARELLEAEVQVCRTRCKQLVLGSNREDEVLDAAGRARLLTAAGGTLPSPARREFSLRGRDQHAPQVLRAVLATDMLLVGAFTERTVLL